MQTGVVMYRTKWCPYCMVARCLLETKGVPVREVDVTRDLAKRRFLKEVTGSDKVPQFFVNGRPIGGCLELMALDDSGRLDRLLSEATSQSN
jgi:glutaredoxin 3